jgi:hypothetical protein
MNFFFGIHVLFTAMFPDFFDVAEEQNITQYFIAH